MQFLLATCFLFPSATPDAQADRQQIDLGGTWQYVRVDELETPPESDQWQPINVPGTLQGWNYQRAWFRRTFSLPRSMQGKRIKLRFDGVKYNSRVYVNGQHIGGCFNGYDAFEVDATEAVRFDKPNELAVGCHDWTGVFSEGRVDFSEKPDWQRPRRFVTDKVIAPIGGHYDLYGIWGDVTLVAVPPVYIKDLFIKPSVRNRQLVVVYTIANESDQPAEVELRAAVEDQGQDVLQLPAVKLSIPAGGEVARSLAQPWPNAHYWSHEDPYLYRLRSQLDAGDLLRTRFGFREFWIEGHRYILNGSKINLLATSWWPPREPMERGEIERQWRALKAAGVICFRTHTQPWRRIHYDVADEVGLLMIIEGAMWHDPYCTRYDDPRYWDNYAKMIHAMLQREKNRPSVIMWSMENEAYSGEEKTRLAVENLARVGKLAKQWDPTRPIYFESDGDPGGVADAIGLHYVHEYPKYTCWPNEAYWVNQPFNPRTWFGITSEPFVWKKDKPLYIGEFLWVPSGTPAAHTVFFGDDAYRNLDLYTRLGKAEAWKMQILAFRHDEVGGMCPWSVGTDLEESNPLYRAHQYAYQPIAAYCLDYDRRFYGGQKVRRRVEIFNDVLSPSELHFRWSLEGNGGTIARGEQLLRLEAGDKQMLDVELPLPAVDRRTPLDWRLTIQRKGRRVFEDTHRYFVFPPFRMPEVSARLGLLGNGKMAELLKHAGIPHVALKSIQDLGSQIDVLVIDEDAFSGQQDDSSQKLALVGRVAPQRAAVMNFLATGGRVLVLRQDAYPEGLFDQQTTSHASTMTFSLCPSHPALRGVEADDLKFWRGDHLVADHELPRPASGAAVSIIVSGSDTGIAHAPLLERPTGRGTIVHCQLRLADKAQSEPAAGRILRNLLDYLGNYRPRSRRTAVLGSDAAYREALHKLRLRFDAIPATAETVDLNEYSLVICHGDVDVSDGLQAKLAAFVRRGGNLLVHRPSAGTMNAICNGLGCELSVQPYSGPITPVDGDHRLLDAVTREDLYWTVKRPGLSWARQPLSREIVDGVFSPPFDAAGAVPYEIERWETSGTYVTAGTQSVLFGSAGKATGELTFNRSGRYGLGIRARGTPCKGVYPVAQLSLDGNCFGTVQLSGDQWRDYGVFGHISKGQHTLTVSFVNDASNPPNEDRNLEVDRVLVVDQPSGDEFFPLTNPPAVVAKTFGGGTVVFDRIRWDTTQDNSRQAARYACSLLTALEANFTPRSATTLECEQMTPQAEMKYYRTNGSTAYMSCNGFVETRIEVAESRAYEAELIASGDSSEGVFPRVQIRIDGNPVAEIQLTTDGWRSYPCRFELNAGEHNLQLWFVNDHSSPSGDRNLRLDKLLVYNEAE